MNGTKATDAARDRIGNIALAREGGLELEFQHFEYSDGDLSTKGAAILGFAGLMLTADLVFLSASEGTYVHPTPLAATLGILAFALLALGAIVATISIVAASNIRKTRYADVHAYFSAITAYHERRRTMLTRSAWITGLGTCFCFLAVILSVAGWLSQLFIH